MSSRASFNLFGSTATGIAVAIALYVDDHSLSSGWTLGQWWAVALFMSLYGFGVGFTLRVFMWAQLSDAAWQTDWVHCKAPGK